MLTSINKLLFTLRDGGGQGQASEVIDVQFCRATSITGVAAPASTSTVSFTGWRANWTPCKEKECAGAVD